MSRYAAILAIACWATPLPLPAQSSSIPIPELTKHVFERVGYGGLPNEVRAVLLLPPNQQFPALSNWLSVQLFQTQALPTNLTTSINNLGNRPSVAGGPTGHNWTLAQLKNERILMAAYSTNQLRERMANFWHTLFNTQFRKVEGFFGFNATGMQIATHAEAMQFDGFRTNALGLFRDLLDVSIDSVAMRIYLDLHGSRPGSPNENYARELLELHTMGPENDQGAVNYTAQDIADLSVLLAGLDVTPGGIITTVNQTSPQAVTLFGAVPHVSNFTLTNPSMDPRANADLFLNHLAAENQTKDYVCRRLIRHFIADEPDYTDPRFSGLLAASKTAWGTQGDITAVLTRIFVDPLFYDDPALIRNLVKTPFEGEVSQIRRNSFAVPVIAATNNSLALVNVRLGLMGQGLFEFPSPDGYPMAATAHADSAKSRVRWASALELVTARPFGYLLAGDPVQLLDALIPNWSAMPPASPSLVASTMLDFYYPNDTTSPPQSQTRDWTGAWTILQQDPNTGAFPSWGSLGRPQLEDRVRMLAAYCAGMTQAYVR